MAFGRAVTNEGKIARPSKTSNWIIIKGITPLYMAPVGTESGATPLK